MTKTVRLLAAFLVPVALATLLGMFLLRPSDYHQHTEVTPAVQSQTQKAHVTELCPDRSQCDTITVAIDTGPEKGMVRELSVDPETMGLEARANEELVVYRTMAADGNVTYQFKDFERLDVIIVLGAVLLLVLGAVAGSKGILSLVGMAFAALVVALFMLPSMVCGHSPVLVGLVGSSAIMFVALYCAHGFSVRTTTALAETLAGLMLTSGIAAVSSWAAHFTGIADETDMVVHNLAPDLNLHSLVVCGIIIAGLGILNDVTITQSSAVWELAGTGLGRRELFTSAMRIGRDHIASTVYTLTFALVGASMTTMIMWSIHARPDIITSELVASEVVSALVGSIGLVLTVPLTTAIAVWAATEATPEEVEAQAGHAH